MKGIPISKSSQLFSSHKDYPIIAIIKESYHENNEEIRFLICDDEYSLQFLNKNAISITDDDISNFIVVENHLRYKNIKIDKRFLNLVNKSLSREDTLEFQSNIWSKTWLIKSLIAIGFNVDSISIELMNDENYKMSLIEGFLEFANEYINFEKYSDEHYDIAFYKEKIAKSYLRFEHENLTEIIENKSDYVIDKIKFFIFKGIEIINTDENLSEKLSRKLFLLIDSIFTEENQKIYHYYDGYKSEKIIFEYNDYFYQLDLNETD